MTPFVIAGVLMLLACLSFYAAHRSVKKERALAVQAREDAEALFDYHWRTRSTQRPSPSNPNPNQNNRGLSQAQITHGERVAERLKKNGRSS